MRVEVAGHWELGWSAPLTEAIQWEMVMREFGVERLNMTPISGIDARWVTEYPSMEELLADRPLTPVFVDEGARCTLETFEHPDEALYVFGKGTYSPFSAMAKDHLSVRIETVKPGMMWPHQALAIIMYDRSRRWR
jgi:hypothetical protein